MVAITIGMIAMLIVMQLYSVSEGNRRSTSGADDAQMSGVIALAGLQHDIRDSGHGISVFNLIGCNVRLPVGVTLSGLAPVTINHASIPAGDPNTDTLLFVYGNSEGAPEGDGIIAQPTPGTSTYTVQTPPAFTRGDWVIAEPQNRPANCSLLLDQIATPAVAPSQNVVVATGTGVANLANGTLYNLGQSPKIRAYAVRNGSLTACDFMQNDCSSNAGVNNSTIWVPIAGNIASLRAQYGRDTTIPMDGRVDVYDQSTPSSASATYACDWVRISALRLALVARSSQSDASAPTSAAPAWEGGTVDNPPGSAAAPINLTANTGLSSGTTWQNYRYKVYQTVVPIRNVTWMGVPTGC